MAGLIRTAAVLALGALAACSQFGSDEPRASERAFMPLMWTPSEISTAGYESSPTFTPDGREMYYVSANPQFRDYQILMSRCVEGKWTRGHVPSFARPLPIIEADPAITHDGKRLYFISSRHAPEKEDFDIWYVDRAEEGWGQPVRLPAPVNTTSSEIFPRPGADGRLYFGSDRPGGHGAGDIYAATQSPSGEWKVENLGPPISTAADDYEAEISRNGRTMIVVSDLGDKSHLYRFVLKNGKWAETGRIEAAPDVFQVGPLLSPGGDRLLFAQAARARSGEMYLIDLTDDPDRVWPPCAGPAAP